METMNTNGWVNKKATYQNDRRLALQCLHLGRVLALRMARFFFSALILACTSSVLCGSFSSLPSLGGAGSGINEFFLVLSKYCALTWVKMKVRTRPSWLWQTQSRTPSNLSLPLAGVLGRKVRVRRRQLVVHFLRGLLRVQGALCEGVFEAEDVLAVDDGRHGCRGNVESVNVYDASWMNEVNQKVQV